MILFGRINLKTLNYHVVFCRLLNFENLMHIISMFKVILQFGFTKFTMECFPCVAGYMWSNLFVFVSAQPLTEALEVDIHHGPSTTAGGDQGIFLVILVRKTDPAHEVGRLQVVKVGTGIH